MYQAVEKKCKKIYILIVKHELVHICFNDLRSNQYLDNKLLPMMKQNIFDNAQQDKGKISISTKCFTYQYLIDNFTLQYYLVKC